MIPLGPWELLRPIGSGSLGEVWSARHVREDVPAAVKVITKARALKPRAVARFRHEVRAVAALDHPSIVRVYDLGRVSVEAATRSRGRLVATSPYMAMELGRYGSLAQLLGRSYRPLPWPEFKEGLLKLLAALAHAHAHGVVHRDVKPANVIWCGDELGRSGLKLADFGIAYMLGAGHKGPLRSAGTPRYMAPEQTIGAWRQFGPPTDLYALGAVAFELASGRPAFAGATTEEIQRAHLNGRREPFEPVVAVPEGFEAWLSTMLAVRPEDRFQQAADAMAALRALDGSEQAAEGPSSGPALRLPGVGLGLWGLREPPLVGREAEREALWAALEGVAEDGRPRALVVQGPAGSGKSRLARWLVQRAAELGRATGLETLHGGAIPGPRDGLLAAVRRHLRCEGLTGLLLAEHLERRLRARGVGEADEWLSLAQLLDPADGPRLPRFSSPRERWAILGRLLTRLARERPLIVWLDDVQHGLDALGFVEHVLAIADEMPAPMPVLFVLTAQAEALAEQPREAAALERVLAREGAEQLSVGPLPEDAWRELAQGALGLGRELAAQVALRVAGNPLYAVHLIGELVERDALEAGDSGLRLREGAQLALPEDLRRVWDRRLERVLDGAPAELGIALELAAVLGESVDVEEWAAVCEAAALALKVEALGGLVERLAAARLAETAEAHPMGLPSWRLAHGMVRESLERRAAEAGRLAGHHACCARVLAAGRGSAARERWARHLAAAGDHEGAAEPLFEAAQQRWITADYGMAELLLQEREAALQALKLAGDDVRWARGWALRASLARIGNDQPGAARWASEAERVAESAGALGTWLQARRERGLVATVSGDPDAGIALLEEAEARCEAAGEEELLAQARFELGYLLLFRGRAREALERCLAAREVFARAGDERQAAQCDTRAADALKQLGELDRCEERASAAVARFEKIGARIGSAAALNLLGEVARLRGDLARAEEMYRRALKIEVAVGASDAVTVRTNLALTLLSRGTLEAAEAAFEEVLTTAQRHGLTHLEAVSRLGLMACAAGEGAWLAWESHVDPAEALLSQGLVDADFALTAERAAELARAAEQEGRARRAWRLALAQWEQLGRAREVARVRAAMAGGGALRTSR